MDSVLEDDHLFLILNPMFIDLDGDGNSELISLFGEFQQGCHLGIFTKQKDGWKCIFFEEFHHHYEGVNFAIMNNGVKEKVIVIKDLEMRGSGIYKEVAHFFKLIDGEIEKLGETKDGLKLYNPAQRTITKGQINLMPSS